ncbi:MAG: motility protein A [Phycisphaeraceae bacterium]|nr:motility protein A [Phycisphaeraceae bacterium]
MDIGTIVGLVIGVGAMLLSVIMGGGDLGGFVDVASIIVVFGGTGGAILIAFPLGRVFKVHKIILKAVFTKPVDAISAIKDLVRFAEIARREGILALENVIEEMRDPFLVRGVKMAVDGTDPELIRSIMDTELESLMERHGQGKSMLDTVARYAPAYGMIGTLLGLIMMLKNLSDPSAIGPGMAVALMTTLYGALIANVAIYPVADKLVARDAEEVLLKTIIIAGVMSIQSGDNPRVVESKLLTYLPPSQRTMYEQASQEQAAA